MDLNKMEVSIKDEPNGNRYQTRGIRKTYVNDVDIGLESDQSEDDLDNLKSKNCIVDEDWNPVEIMLSNDDMYSSDDYQSDSFDFNESDFDEHFNLKENKKVSYEMVDDQFICSECCQFFQKEEDAEKHINEHRKGFVICDVCQMKCKSTYSLSFHKLNTHTSVHRCSICPLKCESVRELKKHSMKCHQSPKGSRMCHMCGLILQTEELWLLHCYEVHEIGEKPEPKYVCQICGKKMYSQSTYQAHKKTHLEKVYKCHYKNCDYKTASKSTLKGHSKCVHLGMRRYKCKFDGCDISFNNQVLRQEHMNMVHFKIRNIPCTWPECKKSFYATRHLKMHIKIHTGEKNLSCEHCDYRCIQKAALNWHLNKKHGIVNEKRVSKCVKVIKPGRKSQGKKSKSQKKKNEVDEEHR